MNNAIKNLLGFGLKVDYTDLMRQGGIILDVRNKDEYASGHIKGFINISVGTLSNNLNKLKKDRPIITCCASGIRSGSAKSILLLNGFTKVYNGGGWISLQNKLR